MVTNNNCDEGTAATGKILQGQGIGTASNYSTATYPSTASSSGKILRADGTNWVASTATYPNTSGTSGNILTSDGTNWVSSAASGGTILNGFLSNSAGSPAASTTYYWSQTVSFSTAITLADMTTRFYIPTSFTLNKVYGNVRISILTASNENCTIFIRVNDTTNTNITTTLQLTASENSFSNSSIGLSLNAGDYISFGITTPAWSTAPQGVSCSFGWSS